MKLKLSIIVALWFVVLGGCDKQIAFEDAETEIASTKKKDNSHKVLEQLGIKLSFRDSVLNMVQIGPQGFDFFNSAYFYTKQTALDTLQNSSGKSFKVLKLTMQNKDDPENGDEILDIITIRNPRAQTVLTRAYITHYCMHAEPWIRIEPIQPDKYGVYIHAATSCGMEVASAVKCDTISLSGSQLSYQTDTTEGRTDWFNMFDKLEEFKNK